MTTAIQLDIRKNMIHALIAGSLVLLMLYVYFLFGTISDTVARTTALSQGEELAQSTSQLEFISIQRKNAISIEDARVLGFTVVEDPQYITRSSLGLVVATDRP